MAKGFERLHEVVEWSAPATVDREHSVIRGVKILGRISRNGREDRKSVV